MTTTTEPTPTPIQAASDFVAWINTDALIPDGYRYELDRPGQKFVRIIMRSNQRSAHAFVDLSNGDLLMAAGWKAPAKGERGNLITGMDEVKARFTWSSGYLYAENYKYWKSQNVKPAVTGTLTVTGTGSFQ